MIMHFKKYFTFAALFLPFTPFTKEIGLVKIAGVDLDILSYPFFVFSLLLFLFLGKISVSKKEAFIFTVVFLIGTVNVLIFEFPLISFFKQFVLVMSMYLVAKTIMKYRDPIEIFKKYVDYAVIAAWIGIAQTLLKLIGIHILSPYKGLDSLALEPSHYIIMILPAFVYLLEKKAFNKKFFLLLLTLFLTFKLTFFLAIVTYFSIRNIYKFKKLVFILPILLLLSMYMVNHNIAFQKRINSAIKFTQTQDMSSIDNLTTFSFLSNLEVAKSNFIMTYGVGVGLGGHETTYIRNFKDIDIYSENWRGTNMKSAHSLLIRVFSELGILGLLILFMLFYKSYKIKHVEYKIIAWASLSHFVAKFFKSGSYFDYGTIFFLVMIIVIIQLDKKKTKEHCKELSL